MGTLSLARETFSCQRTIMFGGRDWSISIDNGQTVSRVVFMSLASTACCNRRLSSNAVNVLNYKNDMFYLINANKIRANECF